MLKSSIEIDNTITFNVYVDKLSKFEKEDTIVCQCVDTNLVVLKTSVDDKPYVFPQALVKQLPLDKSVTYRENDFTLLVNVDGIKKMGGAENTNVLYTSMLHEMLHGFGILQNLYLKKLGKDDVNYVLVPKRISAITREEVDKIKSISDFDAFDQKFGGFYPLTIYEKNIVDINSKNYLFNDVALLYSQIDCFDKGITLNEMKNEDYKKCIGQLPAQTQQLLSSLPANYYLKAHSMGFLNSDGKVIPLQTFDNEYHSRTSVNHIEFAKTQEFYQYVDSVVSDRSEFTLDKYINERNVAQFFDENLLMCPYNMYLNESLFLSTVGKNNKYGWISSDILSILTTMGWTEKGKPKATNPYYVQAELPESLNFPLTMKEYYPKQSVGSSSSSSSSVKAISSTLFLVSMIYFMISFLM